MSDRPPFFDDLSKLAMSAGATMLEWRKEMEKLFHAQIESWSRKVDLVTREEFEVVRDMAQKAREENEALQARLEQLEKSSTGKSGAAGTGKNKTASTKTSKATNAE